MSGLMLQKQATEEQIKFGEKYLEIITEALKQFTSMKDTTAIKNAILPMLDNDMELNVFDWNVKGDINILFNEKTHPITAIAVRVDEQMNIETATLELEYQYVTDEDIPYDTISYNHRLI